MAWCPNCGDGYREDARVCGWCGETLIPGPMPQTQPPETTGQFSGWQQLCKVRSTAQIALITGLLEGAQVPYMTWDPGAGQYLRIVMGLNAFGQEIYVPEDRLDQARGLLRAYIRAGPEAMIFEDPGTFEPLLSQAGEDDLPQDGPEAELPEDGFAEYEPPAEEAPRPEAAWRTLPGLLLGLYWVVVLLALAVGRVSQAVVWVLLVLGAVGTVWFFRGKIL